MVNLIFGCIDNRSSFITRLSPVQSIWDALFYIGITFKPIMQFENPLRFWLSFQLITFCPKIKSPTKWFRHENVQITVGKGELTYEAWQAYALTLVAQL